jgi:hypothetical protein
MATPTLSQRHESLTPSPACMVSGPGQILDEPRLDGPNSARITVDVDRTLTQTSKSAEEFEEHFSLLKRCAESGCKEATGEIFRALLNVASNIASRTGTDDCLQEVFNNEALHFDAGRARFEAAKSRRQQLHGFDHPATIKMSLAYVALHDKHSHLVLL